MEEILDGNNIDVLKKKNRNFSIIFWIFSALAIVFRPGAFYLTILMALGSSPDNYFFTLFVTLLAVCFIVLSVVVVRSTYFLTKSIIKSIIFTIILFVGIFVPALPLVMVPELFFAPAFLLLIPYLFIKKEYLNLITEEHVPRFWYLPGAILMGIIFTISLQGVGFFIGLYDKISF